MDAQKFINELFLRFPPEEVDGLDFNQKREDYLNAISTDEETYDYVATLKDIISNYEYKCTPAPFNIRHFLKRHVLVRVKQKSISFKNMYADRNGLTYEFGVEINPEQTEKELKLMGFTNIRLERG